MNIIWKSGKTFLIWGFSLFLTLNVNWQLTLDWAIVEVKSFYAALHHSPFWTNSSYKALRYVMFGVIAFWKTNDGPAKCKPDEMACCSKTLCVCPQCALNFDNWSKAHKEGKKKNVTNELLRQSVNRRRLQVTLVNLRTECQKCAKLSSELNSYCGQSTMWTSLHCLSLPEVLSRFGCLQY